LTVAGVVVVETERLVLRRFTLQDSGFVRELVNEPGWLRYVGDRSVHTLEDAVGYLERTLLAQYARLGFGFYRVELAGDGTPVGLCGVVHRQGMDDADIGFAMLARHSGRGYAREAARRVVRHAREDLGLSRLTGITLPGNAASIALLEGLGMRFERTIRLPGGTEDLSLYGMALAMSGMDSQR
jgi:RimJ/RimL family protein N-acetyltransferase